VPGDGLWLRERARVVGKWDGHGPPRVRVRYDSDGTDHVVVWPDRLKPVALDRCISNGVHKEGSRWTGIITDVRIERVQDITEADAIAEGFEPTDVDDGAVVHRYSARRLFQTAWARFYPGSWESNDWVTVTRWAKASDSCGKGGA
jgi:hypothetical protein